MPLQVLQEADAKIEFKSVTQKGRREQKWGELILPAGQTRQERREGALVRKSIGLHCSSEKVSARPTRSPRAKTAWQGPHTWEGLARLRDSHHAESLTRSSQPRVRFLDHRSGSLQRALGQRLSSQQDPQQHTPRLPRTELGWLVFE